VVKLLTLTHQFGAINEVNKVTVKKFKADNLLQNISTAIMVLDQQLHICFANNAACVLMGQSEKRIAGLGFDLLFRHLSIPMAKFRYCVEQHNDFSDSEVQVILIDSRPMLLELNCSALMQDDCHYALIECKQVDLQKRIVQESQHENQHQAARGLVRGLAHEIKNPLGGIRGAAQLLQKQLPSDDLKEFTGLIIEQSDRLRKLVDRLLGPNKPPAVEPVNIHLVIGKTLKLVKFEQGDNLEIKFDYDPSIPSIDIDPELIQQTLLNIIRNAVYAMSQHDTGAQLVVSTRIKQHQTIHGRHHKMCLEIKIIDNGPGIPKQLKDTLFFPLVSGNASGTGLGLSISQTLIHQHQGRIDCDSWPGHTEFILLLPFISKEVF
jgi:two-component system nitrogen regulation sensor histidine kinase GlnL